MWTDVARFLVDLFGLPSSVVHDLAFVLCFTPMFLLIPISVLLAWLFPEESDVVYLDENLCFDKEDFLAFLNGEKTLD